MRERLFIFGSVAFLVVALVGLNAASYVQKEKIPDSEANPHRSTYNTGPTGTRAFHDLLVSTGRQVTRWEHPVSELAAPDNADISTFVLVGATRREITDIEIEQLLSWVDAGGMLVIVDRDPPAELLQTTAEWTIRTSRQSDALSDPERDVLIPTVDPSNSKQMTDGENAAKPLQPTPMTVDVTAVQPSKFATTIIIAKDAVEKKKYGPKGVPNGIGSPEPSNPQTGYSDNAANEEGETDAPGTNGVIEQAPAGDPNTAAAEPDKNGSGEEEQEEIDYTALAPVVHIGNGEKNLLAVFPHGYGSIALLTDPYIISNGGVNLVDNAALALNLVSAGTIAFDEYHQGYGSDQNRLLSYFTGTPVIPVFLQLFLLIGLLMFSQSRRFARPLPMGEPNRLSKLEYVAAMAQLKRRTKAFDLAIENIYTDFRRRVSRLGGIENSRSRDGDFAVWIANRSDYKPEEINRLIKRCEDIMHGDPTNKKEVLALSAKIREIEKTLGLRRGRNAFHK